MKSISRLLLFMTLMVVITTACAGQQASPTATIPPTDTATLSVTSTSTATLTPTATTTLTPVIPVTGPITASQVCQFCMDTFTYALLDIPAAATFTILTPTVSASEATDVPTGCNTVETFRDRQLVLCRAPSLTSLSMNVCQGEDCVQFTINLQACPPPPPGTALPTMTPIASSTPTVLVPLSSPTSPPITATVGTPISTPAGSSPTSTTTATPTATPTP